LLYGEHKVVWDGTDNLGNNIGSGVYLYKMQLNGYSKTKKMLLLK